MCCFVNLDLLLGITSAGKSPILSRAILFVECITTHEWGPPGTRDTTNFVKHVFVAKDALGENHG